MLVVIMNRMSTYYIRVHLLYVFRIHVEFPANIQATNSSRRLNFYAI